MEIVEVEKKHYRLAFDDADIPGSGYSFPCDKDGRVLWESVSCPDIARKNLAVCKAHPERWTADSRDGRVVQIIRRVRYGVCPYCGRRVYFGGSSTECECGQWYNVFGQEIKPPENWEDD